MKNKKNSQMIIIAVLSFAILFMTVGFAVYATTLNINGTATVGGNKWSVHYVDTTYAESAGSKVASSKTIADTAVTYSVTLDKPGDFYEFTINVINDGSFNAKLDDITMTALTAAQQKYLTYTLTYDGTAYTASQTGINNQLPYASGSNTKVVKVRVEYIQPETSSDLPENSVDVTLTAALDYTQAS